MTPERFRRLKWILARRQHDLTVLMDRVHKPHNFSAVVRTCDAVGVRRAHIVPAPDYRAGARTRSRTAMGASRYVPVVRHASLGGALEELRAQGMQVVAAHPSRDSADFRAIDYTAPTAILVGTELEGLSDAALEAADRRIAVPMEGAVASLNVSVAAAVVLFEAQRQRSEAGMYETSLPDTEEIRQTLFEWAYPRIADLCRRRGVPYPELDHDGAIAGPVPR
ncbi:MAG: tRNA (guanosine(18)-2'-O)-methyltransferase TrmH [Gemmatimonadota bacterium]|jgi:tRNA (guanosine-2'-O-)-methyltransferase